jgi:hypothetical protein
VITWFGWHDGTVPDARQAIAGGWLLSLDRALELYENTVIAGEDWQDFLGWLPIVTRAPGLVVLDTKDAAALHRHRDRPGGAQARQWWQPTAAIPVRWWTDRILDGRWEWDTHLGHRGRIIDHSLGDRTPEEARNGLL